MKADITRAIIGTKPCKNCGATIKFYNDVSFQYSLRQGGTFCRQCSGAIRKNRPHATKVLSANPVGDND